MDELLNQISAELSKSDTDPTCISVVDLDYAYGQKKLTHETSKQCSFAITEEKINEYNRFTKKILRPGRPTHNIPKENTPYSCTRNTRMARRPNNRHTRRKRRTHQKTGIVTYKTRKRRLQSKQKKSKFRLKETGWQGHTIAQNGIRPNKEKTKSINKQNPTRNTKTLKAFLGAIQYIAKFIPRKQTTRENC